MVDVFISYSRSTRARVEPIKHKLDALGLDCFFDMHQIDGGANFPDVIDRALRDSKSVLCCWSPEYFKGQWSMIECRDALARGIIVPVAVNRFEQFAPPADLRQINWFDLVSWAGEDDHEDWVRTLQNLGKLIGRDLTVPSGTHSGSAIRAANQAPVADPAVQARAHQLADLRTTWAAFPDNCDITAVERFLERIRNMVVDSGFEFEIEHHLDGLRRDAARRAERAERSAAERQAQQDAEAEARRLALEAWRQPGTVWRDAIPGMPEDTVPEMVTIPTGKSCPAPVQSADHAAAQDDRDQRYPEVTIDYCFALGKHPVTFADLDAAIAVGAKLEWPADQGFGRDRHPAINVNWHDAKAYVAWLNSRLGLTGCADAYRLPSECEWEYACSAGGGQPASGDRGDQGLLEPVGCCPANSVGLNYMDGRILEWCEDHWRADLASAGRSVDGSPWVDGQSGARVLRGGSWKSPASEVDLNARVNCDAVSRREDIGFRLARTLTSDD